MTREKLKEAPREVRETLEKAERKMLIADVFIFFLCNADVSDKELKQIEDAYCSIRYL